MSDSLNTYAILDDAAAASIAADVKAVQTGGHTSPGDLGGGLYNRVSEEPSLPGKFRSQDRYLPDGTTDAADGGWWQLAERSITLQMFGAEPGAYADAALVMAMTYAESQGAEIVVCGAFKLANLNTFEHSFVLRGITGRQTNASGPVHNDGFYCDPGAGIHARHTPLDPEQNPETIGWGSVLSLFFQDSGTGSGVDPVALLELSKGTSWTFSNVIIRGANKRAFGFRAGIDGGVWNSTFHHIDARDCGIGGWIGGPSDSSDNNIVDCTFHWCSEKGLVIQNPVGGSITNSSIEWNMGPVGLHVLSQKDPADEAHSYRAQAFRIASNYIYKNSTGDPDAAGSCGILIGTPPSENEGRTDPWNIIVEGNYLANPEARFAVISYALRYSVIANNTPVSAESTTVADFDLIDDGTTTLANNRSQDRNQTNAAVDTAGWRQPVFRLAGLNGDGSIKPGRSDLDLEAGGSLVFAGGAGLTTTRLTLGEDEPRSRKHAALETLQLDGAGNVWTTVFEPATNFPAGAHGLAKLLIAIEQTNNYRQASFEIAYSSPLLDHTGAENVSAAFQIVFQNPDPAPDATQWRIDAGALQVKRNLNWRATIVATIAIFPYSA